MDSARTESKSSAAKPDFVLTMADVAPELASPSFLVGQSGAPAQVEMPPRTLGKKIELPAPDSPERIARETGTSFIKVNDTYTFTLSVQGSDRLLFSAENTAAGLKQARDQMRKLVIEKQQELTTSFNVGFCPAGEIADQQYYRNKAGAWQHDGETIRCREPKLTELYAVGAALMRSQPSHYTSNLKDGVKFYFLQGHRWKDSPTILADYGDDRNGRAAIFVDSTAMQSYPSTEMDAAVQSGQKKPDMRHNSMEAVFTHELAHNALKNMSWTTMQSGQTQTLAQQFAPKLGWRVTDPSDMDSWMLQGKDNYYYKLSQRFDGLWVRYNDKGHMVDAKGKVVSNVTQALHLTSARMQEAAKIKPSSTYFDNISEEMAEGLMYYRLGGTGREKLAKESPELYTAVEQMDQAEIKRTFGTNADGRPKYVRNNDGLLVATQ